MAQEATQNLYRMRDLVRLTGLTNSAIRFYITEGLAPGPKQQGRNTALYGEDTYQGLLVVSSLRQQEGHSVASIKKALDGNVGKDTKTVLADLKNALLAMSDQKPAYTLADLAARTGLSQAQIRLCEKWGLIVPSQEHTDIRFDEADLDMAKAIGELLDMGATWDQLGAIAKSARDVLEQQIQLFDGLKDGKNYRETLAVGARLLTLGKQTNRYLFDRQLKREVERKLTAPKKGAKHAHA